jgi:hypothetical protein
MPNFIQKIFQTNLKRMGTLKEINKSISDWFQQWARANLPSEYVRTNIDGLIISDKGNPKILLETKRSSYALERWLPFDADSRNYYLQHIFTKDTDLQFWTVYHIKGAKISDEEKIALFTISNVDLKVASWIDYEKTILEARNVLLKVDLID